MNALEEFSWRGLVHGHTDGLAEVLATRNVVAYVGFDPSAPSLHIGSLLTLMAAARLQRAGHCPIVVIGGATGLVGDPSGKGRERMLLSRAQIEANVAGIRAQVARFLDFNHLRCSALLLNNNDWLGSLDLLGFLRDVGKHFTVRHMLAKESVKRRMDQEAGLSFTEFSYMLMQAYDFQVLYDRFGCEVQLGGSDQWGNITAGIELIRRVRGASAYGLVLPLVTTATGIKFGKTEAGAVWLDPTATSPIKFYQFWRNTDDREVIRYLKYFTWLSEQQIQELEHAVRVAPDRRQAQRVLADEVTRWVHGDEALQRAQHASEVLFGGEMPDLALRDVLEIFGDAPCTEMAASRFADEVPLVELLLECGLAASRSGARTLIRNGGIYLNGRRITEENHVVSLRDTIEGHALVLRRGQKHHHLVALVR